MEDFLAFILTTIADALLELVLDALFALIGRVLEDIFAGIRKPVPFVTAVSALLLGGGSGELSLVPTESFTYVFLFAFAIALVRFVFVK